MAIKWPEEKTGSGEKNSRVSRQDPGERMMLTPHKPPGRQRNRSQEKETEAKKYQKKREIEAMTEGDQSCNPNVSICPKGGLECPASSPLLPLYTSRVQVLSICHKPGILASRAAEVNFLKGKETIPNLVEPKKPTSFR